METVLTVFRSGATEVDLGPNTYKGGYLPEYVQAMQRQVRKWAPKGTRFVCLSDVQVPDVECIPLTTDWPGWWSKMEMFHPGIRGDFLYMDLDTVIVGPIGDFFRPSELVLLRDFYRNGAKYKDGVGSGLMYLPEANRAKPWECFVANPAGVMKQHAVGGDQRFLERYYLKNALRWQDILPGQIVSYKVDCAENRLGKGIIFKGVPEGARVICCHGQPRPWQTKQFEGLYKW